MIPLLAALLATPARPDAATVATLPAPVPAKDTPAIRISLNSNGKFLPGDRVTVRVETRDDGYMIVFRIDTDGHIRVLFPLDPDLDPFVRGGKSYELRGRGDRQTFFADEQGGTGVIYAAIAREPLVFRDFSTNAHWDYDALKLSSADADPEAELSALVTRMTDNGPFDYDVLNYSVGDQIIASTGGYAPSYYTPTYGYDPYLSPYYDPWYGLNCLTCRWGARPTGWGITLGIGYSRGPGWYDPWYTDPFFWDPWYYGYDPYFFGNPHRSWRYPGQGIPYTVITTPRPPVPAGSPYGQRSRIRPGLPSTGSGALVPSRTAGAPANTGRNTGTYAGDRARQPIRPPSRATAPSSSSSPKRAEPQGGQSTRGGGTPSRAGGAPARSGGSSGGGGGGGAPTGGRSRSRGGGTVTAQDPGTPAQAGAPTSTGRAATTRTLYIEPSRMEPTTLMPPQASRSSSGRPVFREPPRQSSGAPAPSMPQPVRDRPVYREPPRSQPVSPPSPSRSAPPPAAPPVVRSAPPSSPPPSGGGGGGGAPRSRSRGGGH